MNRFTIVDKGDGSIVEIIALNIDSENNILIKEGEGDKASIISLAVFKDMILGISNGSEPTHVIFP